MTTIAIKSSLAGLVLLALAGCGQTPGERGLTGAGIGAAGGAIGGAMLGAPATGALIGGAIGGATGALTDEDDIDLGDPFWK
jgi:hypothetical protein